MSKDGDHNGSGLQAQQVRDLARESTGHCPSCKKPTVTKWRPFCSRRCADVDLNRWLTGRYVIPGGGIDEDEDGVPGRADIEGSKSE